MVSMGMLHLHDCGPMLQQDCFGTYVYAVAAVCCAKHVTGIIEWAYMRLVGFPARLECCSPTEAW